MTTAVREILKQIEWLSVEEKMALTARLIEQMPPNEDLTSSPIPGNNSPGDHEPRDVFNLNLRPPEDSREAHARFVNCGMGEPAQYDFSDIFGDDANGIPDAFDLNRVPPKRTYTIRGRFKFVGRATPLPFELDEDQ